MKIMLDVKNASALKKPSQNQIILYDGEKWYVTTRQALFKEYEDIIDEKMDALENKEAELEKNNDEFKKKVAKDILQMSAVIESIYKKD